MDEVNNNFKVLLINPDNKQKSLIKPVIGNFINEYFCGFKKYYTNDTVIAFWNYTWSENDSSYYPIIQEFFNNKHAIMYLVEKNELCKYLILSKNVQKKSSLINDEINPLEILININGYDSKIKSDYPEIIIKEKKDLTKIISDIIIKLKELYN